MDLQQYRYLSNFAYLSSGFIRAHKRAQVGLVHAEAEGKVHAARMQVVRESQAEIRQAVELLKSYPRQDVEAIVAHKVAVVVINKAVSYISKLSERRLLRPQETDSLLEKFQEALNKIEKCDEREHLKDLDLNEHDSLVSANANEAVTEN